MEEWTVEEKLNQVLLRNKGVILTAVEIKLRTLLKLVLNQLKTS